MPTVSLIAPPGRLEAPLVSSLQAAFGATSDALWLSPDEAAEFSIEHTPSNVSEVRQSIAEMHVDLNVIPDQDRRKIRLIADMDSTMIGQECIDELAAEAG
ncbi:MAG: phosphoserine phosphatase SerB, partial [Pseudomonadota bacterium]